MIIYCNCSGEIGFALRASEVLPSFTVLARGPHPITLRAVESSARIVVGEFNWFIPDYSPMPFDWAVDRYKKLLRDTIAMMKADRKRRRLLKRIKKQNSGRIEVAG